MANYIASTGTDPGVDLECNNKIGINTSSSAAMLDVRGDDAVDNSLSYQLHIANNTDAYSASPKSGISFANIYRDSGALAGMGGIMVGKENGDDENLASYLTLHTRPAGGSVLERLRIASNGDTGIGTNSPSYRLHVEKPGASCELGINADSDQHAQLLFAAAGSNEWAVYRPAGSSDLRIHESGQDDRVTFQAGGNVGIGTTNPGYMLHMHKSAAACILELDTYDDGSGLSTIVFKRSHDDSAVSQTLDNDDLGRIEFWGVDSGDSFKLTSYIRVYQN
ncbi:MAG: hypothetical protein ABIA63_04825, partial [bacterium]